MFGIFFWIFFLWIWYRDRIWFVYLFSFISALFFSIIQSARLAAQKKREQNQLLDSQKNSDIIGGDESQLADDDLEDESQTASQQSASHSKPQAASVNTMDRWVSTGKILTLSHGHFKQTMCGCRTRLLKYGLGSMIVPKVVTKISMWNKGGELRRQLQSPFTGRRALLKSCWFCYCSSSQGNKKAGVTEEKLRTDELLPLDQAIIWSIDHCGKSIVYMVVTASQRLN